MSKIYLDSSFVIDLTDPDSPRFAGAHERYVRAEDGRMCISLLVRLESRVRSLRVGDDGRLARIELLLSETEVLPLDEAVFERATALRAHHGIKTPDAIHLACALVHGCEELWTGGNLFGRVAQAVSGLRVQLTQ